mgnify:CR=1 FL=1
MKEGIGGTFMIYVFLVFLAVYITFLAVAFNYARAFRVKNKVIDIIEQNEGMDFTDISDDSTLGQIENYLGQVSYVVTGIDRNDCPTTEYNYINDERGYCIQEVSGTNGEYYKVKTFIKLEIPFLDLGFTIPVKGETRKIERINT